MSKKFFLLLIISLCCVSFSLSIISCENDTNSDAFVDSNDSDDTVVDGPGGSKIYSEGLDYELTGGTYAVTDIGTCTDTDIVIPATYNSIPVTSIESSAFSGYTSLKSVDIPDSVTSIGSSAFSGCSSLTSVTMDSVTSIGESAFSGCSSLKSVDIPDSVTSIGASAFSGCSSLTSIDIPDSVTSIGSSAFSGCSSLESITLPFVGGSANASGASASTLFGYIFGVSEYEGGISTKQYYAGFDYETYFIPKTLTTVTITGGEIFYGAFSACGSLKSVTMDSVTLIGDFAFFYCSSLTSIDIPDSVTSIGNYAFFVCSSLTSVTMNSVTSIGDGAFFVCSSLTSVTMDSVTSIGIYAFYDCSSLESVTMNSVTSIGISAFESCSSLESVTMDSVTSIGNYAFYGCDSLTSVTMDSVKSIGKYAFSGCSSLTSVTIPSGVTAIGICAFYYCTSLKSVTFGNTSGWYVTQTENATSNDSGSTILSASDLNVSNLTSTYSSYYWYCKS